MKKIVGQQGRLMGMAYKRVMPQAALQTVGSFFLLDHFYERYIAPQAQLESRSTGVHPHRGITTLTYIIKGQNQHLDSMGNRAVVEDGGVQWMKAGRGIVHDEGAPATFQLEGGDMHMMQFWILLGENEREDAPAYIPLQQDAIPERELDERGSVLRILLGTYCAEQSILPSRKSTFLYHLHLKSGSCFYYTVPEGHEMALLAAKGAVNVNDERVEQSDLMASDHRTETVKIQNLSDEAIDVMLFGGEPFGESYYSSGPFVMKDYAGVVRAYRDYEAGMYGEI